MIRNGLYVTVGKVLDGVEGSLTGVSVLRDGSMHGGTAFFYHVGSYRCSEGKWKGSMIHREHNPAPVTAVFAGKEFTTGFSGTYTNDSAEFEAAVLSGKRSFRMKVTFRLLVPV
jgi:hypothetical protein